MKKKVFLSDFQEIDCYMSIFPLFIIQFIYAISYSHYIFLGRRPKLTIICRSNNGRGYGRLPYESQAQGHLEFWLGAHNGPLIFPPRYVGFAILFLETFFLVNLARSSYTRNSLTTFGEIRKYRKRWRDQKEIRCRGRNEKRMYTLQKSREKREIF